MPTLEVRVEQPDSLFRLANRAILHFEFQTTKDIADLRRFYRYQHAVSEFYDEEVHAVVLYGPGITEAPNILRRGSAVYTVHNVFIGLQDGEAALTALQEKLARGETLDEADLARLKLLPLMAARRPLQEILRDAITLAGKLPQPERNTAIGTMLGLAYHVRPVSLGTGVSRVEALLYRQHGTCAFCGLHFRPEDLLEIDHIVPLSQGGNDWMTNKQALHRHCHDRKTALARAAGY